MTKRKFALMGGWNTDSGASIHCEILGRSLKSLGQDVTVFTFYDWSFFGNRILREHEDFVIPAFSTSFGNSAKHPSDFNALPFLLSDYEFFIVENLGTLPMDRLKKIFHHIKRKAKCILVVHEGRLWQSPEFYQFDWDAIIAFDARYRAFLQKVYPPDRIYELFFPAVEMNKGNKKQAREELGLPKTKKIVYMFGAGAVEGADIIEELVPLKSAGREYDFMVLVTSTRPNALEKLRKVKDKGELEIEIREEAPPLDRLYTYLHASDCLLYHKESAPDVVLSSTAYQTLGSGICFIALRSNYVEYDFRHGEILIYDDAKGLRQCVMDVFEETERYKRTLQMAERFVGEFCGENLAKKLLRLVDDCLL